ncbi:MAG: DNA mismatch repair endonuclease MutL [Bacillota bacterium]|nr:DNA mismatch repair endonuclease MutL [Bacillota bacterium]
MNRIQLLSKQVANLIAAGEVVDRPSSVVKELIENAIDAGSKSVTIEIKNGGSTYIRITDDGCGMNSEDAAKAFLRHATSKISRAEDLSAIKTLGFRGEALAAIASVSKTELITCEKDSTSGTRVVVEGGELKITEETGAPAGTTIIVRDLFFNTPARRKFLKKDVTESASIAGLVQNIALCNPFIQIRFIRDGRETLFSPGTGLSAAVYACFGKETSSLMLPVDFSSEGIHVTGFVGKPETARPNRNMQHFSVNSRMVKSRVLSIALEESMKHSIMVGKYPICVLNAEIDFGAVDVNVHPSKIEVKFSDERSMYDAIFFAVRETLANDNKRQEMRLPIKTSDEKTVDIQNPKNEFVQETAPKISKPSANIDISAADWSYPDISGSLKVCASEPADAAKFMLNYSSEVGKTLKPVIPDPAETGKQEEQGRIEADNTQENEEVTFCENEIKQETLAEEEKFRIAGELFNTYIIAEFDDKVLFIDKHAAQERMLYEKLKTREHTASTQALLQPVVVSLTPNELAQIAENMKFLEKLGFEAEIFGTNELLVRGVPTELSWADINGLIIDIASQLQSGKRDPRPEVYDDILHSIACKAAIKGGQHNAYEDILNLVKELLAQPDIKHCPHGRPVVLELTKSYFEKQFKRQQ